jgi:hypothetical protein
MEQQISQGYLSAFIFVFYPGGGHYKNIQHVKGRTQRPRMDSNKKSLPRPKTTTA